MTAGESVVPVLVSAVAKNQSCANGYTGNTKGRNEMETYWEIIDTPECTHLVIIDEYFAGYRLEDRIGKSVVFKTNDYDEGKKYLSELRAKAI